MKKISLLMFLLLSILLCSSYGYADDDVWTMAKSDKYGTKFQGMLGRGLLNIATCFVDLIQHTVEGTQEGPPFVGTLTGLGSGLGCTALRVSSGALDVVTSWVPGFNGFPVAKSYSDCLEQDEATSPVSESVASSGGEETVVVTSAPREKRSSTNYVKK
ncbi:MAG: hypothetical protein HYZ84_02190 [Candidatus Omnitrophica bacterium]|nr:hypothetical protein [Candidatus Omnitrophota bacterium]